MEEIKAECGRGCLREEVRSILDGWTGLMPYRGAELAARRRRPEHKENAHRHDVVKTNRPAVPTLLFPEYLHTSTTPASNNVVLRFPLLAFI